MEILFLSEFGKAFIPKKARPHLHFFFEKTGVEGVPYHTIGLIFWISAFTSLGVYLTQIYPNMKGKDPATFFIITFIAFSGIMLIALAIIIGFWYFRLTMRIYDRTKEMEAKLADYLTLVSTSLKGGYSFEKALWGAIKPEFGILANEIGLVSKRVMTGNDIADALNDFGKKYDSPILRRSINLIIGELESGGKIVEVIDRVIANLKKTKALKEEMSASTLTYMIFISALVMFVMPALFALSFTLFNVITGFLGNITSSMSSSPMAVFRLTKPSIQASDFKVFNILAIMIIAGSSSMIVSIIEKGNIRGGVKYLPIFVITSLAVYLLCMKVIGGLFSSIMLGA